MEKNRDLQNMDNAYNLESYRKILFTMFTPRGKHREIKAFSVNIFPIERTEPR